MTEKSETSIVADFMRNLFLGMSCSDCDSDIYTIFQLLASELTDIRDGKNESVKEILKGRSTPEMTAESLGFFAGREIAKVKLKIDSQKYPGKPEEPCIMLDHNRN